LRPGYAVGQPQVATRSGCKVSRPQAAIFSPLQGLFLFAPAIRDDDPTETQRGRVKVIVVDVVCDAVAQTLLLCLPRDDIISKFREIV
jgi:hypothetical protein